MATNLTIPPDYSHEAAISGIVAGVDEAGRGPWAGPVVAAAVILDPQNIPHGLNDSKKLSSTRRDALFTVILNTARYGIGWTSVEEIDRINILQARMLAMQRAIATLPVTPDHALIDGNRLPTPLPCNATALVRGDARSLSIAAASILAKVTRDRHMQQLAVAHPHYGWDSNAGYGTRAHQEGLATHGITQHHRRSFAPIARLLQTVDAA